MIDAYNKHVAERETLGIPPLPLNPEQTEALCGLLESPPAGQEAFLLDLLENRIAPGVDPAAKVKAAFLGRILSGEATSPLIDRVKAIAILGTMLGGYNVRHLIDALSDEALADTAVEALSGTILVYDAFDDVAALSATNEAAKRVVTSWAEAGWFTARPALPAEIRVRVFKVDGETNTDDLSPASDAWSRPDIPLHALSMGRDRFPGGIETIAKWRAEGHRIAFIGDVVGTGSSRKSACNSVLWHIGDDIPAVPNKRRGGVIIGGAIAPIFFNTAEDSGGLPLFADVTALKTGDDVVIDTSEGTISTVDGEVLTRFSIRPNTLADEFQAGGRIPLIIGRALTARARAFLGLEETTAFAHAENPEPAPGQGYTQAQKIVGQSVGLPGVLPGTACEPKMTTVLSQDTTGPMTADELKELACLKFQSPLFLQSFCHTAAYPKAADVHMHQTLPAFIVERKGVPLRPGDGVCHSWINRLLVPDTVGTGGDSHTRFPLGISFPAGSGLVAFAGALGFMPLDMPESVLVRFKGAPYFAIQQGLLTVPKKNKKNIFNGRILEMEGLPDLTVEQGFEAHPRDGGPAGPHGRAGVRADRRGGRALGGGGLHQALRSLGDDLPALQRGADRPAHRRWVPGCGHAGRAQANTLRARKEAIEAWIEKPELLSADANAAYAAVIEIDLAEITEPILACPNDPDDVKLLSEVAGTKVDDVFLGSCMTNIGHFRAAGQIWKGQKQNPSVRTYVCPPTRMDQAVLKGETYFNLFNQIGARIEVPGCSLCMGNQLRVPDGGTVFSTSTRNFDNRMGTGAKIFLGSAELGAVTALEGALPTPERYLAIYAEKIAPRAKEIYRYLQLDELGDFDAIYGRRDL